jgi:RNA polymerase sigma-70 factor (ECF subfamily)
LPKLKAGDDAAWNELYNRVGPGLYNYIISIIKDREKAADLLQEAFVKLARSVKTIRKEDALKSWLYVTSRNMACDLLRKRSEALADQYCSEQADAEDQPDDVLIKNETYRELFQALGALPRVHREVVELRLWGDMSYSEISSITGDPVGTLRSRYCWAIRKLRKCLFAE